ncbi:hypothetical protein BDD12DRAFT_759080, partial [Trichophaea hybrida]
YHIHSSNISINETMIPFTGQSIHNMKKPNKSINQENMFLYLVEKEYIWEFHLASNKVGGNPVDIEFHLLQLTDIGKIVNYLTEFLYPRYCYRGTKHLVIGMAASLKIVNVLQIILVRFIEDIFQRQLVSSKIVAVFLNYVVADKKCCKALETGNAVTVSVDNSDIKISHIVIGNSHMLLCIIIIF